MSNGNHNHLNDLAYRLRELLGEVLNEADSADPASNYTDPILNIAFTNGWTLSQLRIVTSNVFCSVIGHCTIHGSKASFDVNRSGFAFQKLQESGLPEDLSCPERTMMLFFDKYCHVAEKPNLLSKLFRVADKQGINLLIVCTTRMCSYAYRLLSFAKAKKIPVSIWSDLDSGGKAGSHSFSNM